MVELVMLMGLPGSGKSTYAENRYSNYQIHSSDQIRKELYGRQNVQENPSKVFQILHKRIRKNLEEGKSCVYDATNISSKKRRGALTEIVFTSPKLKELRDSKSLKLKCIMLATPWEICLERNRNRLYRVPTHTMNKMYKNFDVPFYHEGWDEIELIYLEGKWETLYKQPSFFINSTLNYNQNSKYHKISLGKHCALTAASIINLYGGKYASLNFASALHDCGKPFTKKYSLSEDNAHYYNHENIGAYNSLFYERYDEQVDKLLAASLIRWHMIPYAYRNMKESTLNKYKELFNIEGEEGKTFWELLIMLHEADKIAH